MQRTRLGRTELEVSKVCLGTMTFGEQNTELEAHRQLDYAAERGINFTDRDEMYLVMGRAETQGSNERFIGSWLERGMRIREAGRSEVPAEDCDDPAPTMPATVKPPALPPAGCARCPSA